MPAPSFANRPPYLPPRPTFGATSFSPTSPRLAPPIRAAVLDRRRRRRPVALARLAHCGRGSLSGAGEKQGTAKHVHPVALDVGVGGYDVAPAFGHLRSVLDDHAPEADPGDGLLEVHQTQVASTPRPVPPPSVRGPSAGWLYCAGFPLQPGRTPRDWWSPVRRASGQSPVGLPKPSTF
jgi:hypothetical protein